MKLRRIVFSATVIVALFAVLIAPVAGKEEEAISSNQDDNTQMQPVSEPPIKLVHVLNPGEREYLSPNLIGVQNIAMTYLPLSMNFINIIDAYREIVNGVRYEILLNAVDTKANDADIICRLVILEKPWLRTEWGDKVRELQHSNCTAEEGGNLNDPIAKNRALNDKYVGNAIFNGGTRNELSNDEMAKLNAQIMPLSSNSDRTTTPRTTTTTTTTATERNVAAQEEIAKVSHKDDAVQKATPVNTNINVAVGGGGGGGGGDDGSVVDDDKAVTTEPSELSDDEKKWLDDYLSVSAINFENSRQTTNNKYNAYNNKNNDNNNNNQNSENDGDSNYVRVQKATFNEQQQHDESAELQHEEQQQVEPDTEQFEPIHVREKRSFNTITGGVSPLKNEEAEEIVQNSLDKLAAGVDGPNYKLGRVYSANRQIVAGTRIRCDVELIDENGKSQRCNIDIWSQPWMRNGNEVTIDCPDQQTLTRRHSRSLEYAEKKSHKKAKYLSNEKAEHLFKKFQINHNRVYHTSMEYGIRFSIFQKNLKLIADLNRNEMGSAKYGITKFADFTSYEYKMYNGLWKREADKPTGHELAKIPDIELPKEFDWREKGVVSEVKNQGSCGSCWAFSVTGNIEGLHAVKTGTLEEYSEQELLDCDSIDSACNGGLPDNAYKAIESIGGLELESDYPYEQRQGQCQFDTSKVHVKVKGAVDLPKNETAIAQWLIANGPISIGINANVMQFYRGGVSHPWRLFCSHSSLDHGVLIVGFGVSKYPKKTLPYWIIKNSWGKKWGEQGYYRVYRGDNTCGVSEMASSAVLEE